MHRPPEPSYKIPPPPCVAKSLELFVCPKRHPSTHQGGAGRVPTLRHGGGGEVRPGGTLSTTALLQGDGAEAFLDECSVRYGCLR
jgi:hypothetical protein